MVTAGIVNELSRSHGHVRIHELIIFSNEGVPFGILGHGNWANSKLFNSTVSNIRLSLENTSISVVRLLYLANDNGLKLPSRILKVQVRLWVRQLAVNRTLPTSHMVKSAYLMQIVFLVNLPFQLAIHC